jgi:HD-like signal output (HDOD) protein
MDTKKVATLIIEKIQSPAATLKEVSDLIQMDKGLTGRVLNVVNRSYCLGGAKVNDVTKALQYIGMGTLMQIVLMAN